ncbi:MAG: VapE domain-containing protein, partial [Catenulispora sp.]
MLYRLPEILAADEVVVVEGEKAADRLAALGVAATCSPGGAGKWRKAYAQALKGKDVIVLPDNDEPGRKHGRDVANSLAGIARSVRAIELPGLPDKGDVADWLEAGHTIGELISLARVTRAHEKTADPSPETAPRARDARAHEGWTDWPVLKGKDGAPVEANVEWALQQAPELAGRLRLNLFTNNIEIMDPPWRPGSGWTTWADVDPGRLASWLQRKGLLVKPGVCRTAAVSIAHDTPHDPVRLYLEGLRWDGTERLSTWLTTHLGADRSTPELARYLTAVGRKWLISAVARTFVPGEKADHMLILEGPQGARKSTALAALVPDPSWFADELATIGTKDADQDLRGKLIIEVAELSAMHRSDVERVKAFLSRKADHYRPSYAMHSADFPRRCVFAGSTNAEAYLLDDTGNRRFWGVKVGKIDVDAIKRDRDQLWAEAVHAYQAGEKWHLGQAEENIAAGEQEKRRQVDPWEDHVRTWLKGKTECTVNEVLSEAVQVPRERQNRVAQMNAARALKAAGWERFQHYEDGARSWRYRPAGTPTAPTPKNEVGLPNSPDFPTHSPTTPTTPTCFDDVPRTRAHHARMARAHHETGSESVGEVGLVGVGTENTGEIPSDPHQPPHAPTSGLPWDAFREWHSRVHAGDVRAGMRAWLTAAGGIMGEHEARMPK